MKFKFRSSLAVLALGCGQFNYSLAQDHPSEILSSRQQLDTVIVSSTRNPVNRNRVPQNITVISKAAIALTPSSELTDIIKKNSSVNVIQYPGLSAGVSIRGFRPQFSGLNQRTLLLVDGRPAGTANIATINTSDVERVEILKGPASALYGSQAMGGVVNVITKKSTGAPKTSLFAEYGSYETFKAGGSTGGSINKRLDYDLSFNIFDRNKNMELGKNNLLRDWFGYDVAVKNFLTGDTAHIDDRRSDGLKREYTRVNYNNENIRFGYKLSDNWRADVKAERFAAVNVEAPSDITYINARPSSKDINKYMGEASVSGKVANHQVSIRGYLTTEDSANKDLQNNGVSIPPYVSYMATSKWNGLQLKDIYTLDQHSLIAGIDYMSATTESRRFTDKTEIGTYSPNYELQSVAAYLQAQLSFLNNRLLINPGARYDLITYDVKSTPFLTNYSPGKETNPFFSPSLATQFNIFKTLAVHGTFGRAFVTPDAYNVAGYSENTNAGKTDVTRGNPNLKNESSVSWDAGVRVFKTDFGLSADITYFFTDVKNRITKSVSAAAAGEKTPDGAQITNITTYVNADKAFIRGLEWEVSYDLGALHNNAYALRFYADATHNFKATEITAGSNGSTYKDINNVAKFTGNFGIEYNTLKGLAFRLNNRYVGKRTDIFSDSKAPVIVYPPFMTVDLSGSYTYARKHTFTLLLNNITDENYYEKRGYNLQGRSFSLRYGLSF
ncbi:TonB-dependent receptor [Desertivirga arenae]|uniref:TonB-dependent receptor n=1 Tax=Desertivirga arenae TaxID=2810309 RepID=UPI001A95DE51|nr:TonB-dependent receptor [Pedobacter sp. SYSU D00823]